MEVLNLHLEDHQEFTMSWLVSLIFVPSLLPIFIFKFDISTTFQDAQ